MSCDSSDNDYLDDDCGCHSVDVEVLFTLQDGIQKEKFIETLTRHEYTAIITWHDEKSGSVLMTHYDECGEVPYEEYMNDFKASVVYAGANVIDMYTV